MSVRSGGSTTTTIQTVAEVVSRDSGTEQGSTNDGANHLHNHVDEALNERHVAGDHQAESHGGVHLASGVVADRAREHEDRHTEGEGDLVHVATAVYRRGA